MTSRKKLNQPISPQFEPNQEEWDRNEELISSEMKPKYNKKIRKNIDPHKKSIEEIIFDVRKVF